jgi:flagellar biosynthesis chaperone FliJ
VAEDNLPRRSRKVRQRHEELVHRLNEIEAGREDRSQEIHEKLDTGTKTGEAQLIQEAFDAMNEELDQMEEMKAEAKEISEELGTLAAEVSVEGSKLRTETLKQQATLAAGAIVGVGAITSVIMPSILHAEVLLWATYVVLLETVVFSVLLMHIEAERVENVLLSGSSSFPSPFLKWSFKAMHIASMSGLPVAVWLFLIFQLFNMSR